MDVSTSTAKPLLSYPSLTADGGQAYVLADGTMRVRLLDGQSSNPYWLVINLRRSLMPAPTPLPLPMYPWLLSFVELYV